MKSHASIIFPFILNSKVNNFLKFSLLAQYKFIKIFLVSAICLLSLLKFSTSSATDSITFKDITPSTSSGISYARTKSLSDIILDNLKQRDVITLGDLALAPIKSRGAPGIALLDYDRDGDQDIYVTNGPGTANSLFSNQYAQSNKLEFIDVSLRENADLSDMDSSGVCYGDIDNDGDLDIYVLGAGEYNVLLQNSGKGNFVNITDASNTAAGANYSTGCSMGDINGDGLLDIVVANTGTTWDNQSSLIIPFELSVHNQLFLNNGNNVFSDVSDSSGITRLNGFPVQGISTPGISWAIAMVDYDLDGDIDIITADDQGSVPGAAQGGIDVGLIHLLNNDGTGVFTDLTVEAGLNKPGAWMGLSFGDLNSDGNMDMFVTNAGDYLVSNFVPYQLGTMASRWFLGQENGSFTDPGIGELTASAIGWGTVMSDYDNDGDTDIVYHGGIDHGIFIDASNPGLVLNNDGNANFSYDFNALKNSSDHSRRNVQGFASGDLNNDGYIDLVSVSNFDIKPSTPLIPYLQQWGTPLDTKAYFYALFTPFTIPFSDTEYTWNGESPENGSLSVEINSADNDNKGLSINLAGSVNLLSDATVNRDGIGAVVRFTPKHGKTVMRPVLGGGSYASQDSLSIHFGLGSASKGVAEVLWPGGRVNVYKNIKPGRHYLLPEIPCDLNNNTNQNSYKKCVTKSLRTLKSKKIISHKQAKWLKASLLDKHDD